MFGLNRRISILDTSPRVLTNSGSVEEPGEFVVASNVPATFQPHVLANLPPPPDRTSGAGIIYLQEQRCWIPFKAILGLTPQNTWIIQDDVTGERFRVRAAVDEGGRGHHWLIRMERYN